MEPATKPDHREEPGPEIVRRAAEWLAHVESGDASDTDHDELMAWRAADPAHGVALDRLGGVRSRLAGTPEVERETLRRLLSPRRRAGTPLLAALALIAGGWTISALPPVERYFADQRTAAGETRVVALADGSRLTLSTDSAVDVDIGADTRSVRLLQGEVLAQVSKGRRLAFEVTTPDGRAIALGTAYSVLREPASTVVAVAESHVRLCPALGDEAACLTLAPGQRGRLTRTAVERLPDVAAVDIAAWADGWLTVDDRPLVDVLDELNRWRAAPIDFDRDALSDLRVSGIFPLRDSEKAARNLTRLLPIVIDRNDRKAIVIRRR